MLSITRFFRIFPASAILLPFWLVAFPFDLFSQKPVVDNVTFSLKESHIEIDYDLIGKKGKNYKVNVELKREQFPGFSVKPQSVKGDVGKGVVPGEKRRIIWDFGKEFLPEKDAEDYYFVVTAKKPSMAWLYVLGGAVVAGGGTAAILLLTNKKDETPTKTFPVPVRP